MPCRGVHALAVYRDAGVAGRWRHGMRRGMYGLTSLVETALAGSPYSGHVFVFRGKRDDLIKVLWADRDGLCLFANCLERGRFVWPQATLGSVHLTPAQLACGRSDWMSRSSAMWRASQGLRLPVDAR